MKISLKIILIMVMVDIYAQPSSPPKIEMLINESSVLEGDFRNRYLMNVNTYQDSINVEDLLESDFYTYKNHKNYHDFEIVHSNYVLFYVEELFPNNLLRLSFLDKKSEKEMNIYFRIKKSISSGDNLKLKNISFSEGNFFFDMCDQNKYYIKYQTIDYDNYFVVIDDIGKHKIKEKKLKKLIKNKKCG